LIWGKEIKGNMEIPWKFHGNSWKFHGNSWKFMEIHGNSMEIPWKFMEIHGNSWKFMEIPWKFYICN
jgi:hypothetical protein